VKLSELAAQTEAMLEAVGRRKRDAFVPHGLHPKQQQWVGLDVLESCYGGAAGGGKTDALLASALRFVDQPNYAALILRRTYPDLALPGAVMDRSHTWLDDTRAQWSDRDKLWTFPSGAKLQFGYCDSENDLSRYKSAEFQFVGIDELTEWPERWATFLFSRLRRLEGSRIPLRFRAATNPDGIGSSWVRERYGIPEGKSVPVPIWKSAHRVFWPARAEDNPSIDLATYEASLEQMTGGRDGIKWKQLREGIWIRDDEGLVYHFNPAVNRAPPANIDDGSWRFILGIDYGFDDATAFAILGWREHTRVIFVVESAKESGLTPEDAAQAALSLEQRYHFDGIIGDTGGLGKGYAEEAKKRFRIPITPAEKHNKRGYIDLLNGALRSRQLMVLPGNEDLEREWSTLPWAEGRQKESAGFANHLADAVLYAWRASSAFLELPAREKKVLTLEEQEDAEERRLAREVDRDMAAGSKRDRSWLRRMVERR
jgi:hypothetical protein